MIEIDNLEGKKIARRGNLPTNDYSLEKKFLPFLKKDTNIQQLELTEAGLIVKSAAPIKDPDLTTQTNGFIMIGKVLNHDFLIDLQKIIKDDLFILDLNLNPILTTMETEDIQIELDKPEILPEQELYQSDILINKKPYLSGLIPIFNHNNQPIGWFMIATSLEKMYTARRALFTSLFVIALVGGIISIIFSFIITNSITGPLNQLVQLSKKIAGGDLRDHFKTSAKGEIGYLGQSFNQMVSMLHNLVHGIRLSSENVARGSEQLIEVTHQLKNNAKVTDQCIQQIVSRINNQQQQLNSAMDNINSLSESITEIDHGINQVASNSLQADHEVELSTETLTHLMTVMSEIKDAVSASHKIINQLGKKSNKIIGIIDIIRNIAEQTNLLALNASIEAARAGEIGRGFAVVAEEIRKLANESHTAAENINELINSINDEINTAVQMMDKSANTVQEGVSKAEETQNVLLSVNKAVRSTRQSVEEMSAYLQNQQNSIKSMIQIVETIATNGNLAVKEANSSSIAIEKQNQTLNHLLTVAQELDQMARNLREQIISFKLQDEDEPLKDDIEI
ncbi:hypothetical protein BBF96_11935 [Anoxybacter fermentans]|uniref:Chemotaxis protein n=1 Tax=Anoxybacter fermentans TaxID=1323375 RepID=A0A3S9T0F2_9FIRM|nr:hypothetical protein BBF96_11935 [Anoxybacter fermentans]